MSHHGGGVRTGRPAGVGVLLQQSPRHALASVTRVVSLSRAPSEIEAWAPREGLLQASWGLWPSLGARRPAACPNAPLPASVFPCPLPVCLPDLPLPGGHSHGVSTHPKLL